jgi:hypothetical protein
MTRSIVAPEKRVAPVEHDTARQLGHEFRVELQSFHVSIGIMKAQTQEAAESGGKLVLATSRDAGFNCLQMTCRLRDLDRVPPLTPRRGKCGHQCDIQRAGASESRSRRGIGTSGEGTAADWKHPKTGLEQIQAAVSDQTAGIRHLDVVVQIFRY